MLFKRLLIALLALVIFGVGALHQAAADQAVIVNLDFDNIRQGNAGVITLSGANVAGGTATALGHVYPFFSTSQGFACLLSAPMTQKIQSYPLTVTVTGKDGSIQRWDGTFKVASGEFIAEMPFSLPSNKMYLLNDDIQANEDTRLLSIYSVVTPTRFWQGQFIMPVNSSLSSPFGSWRQYNGIVQRRHTGQDLHASVGTPVLASADGRVVFSRALDIHGESVVIDHGWGVFSEYSHLSARYVVPGQVVLQGDVIGLSGDTGRSTGPHVHWEIAVNGNWVDPINFTQMKLPN
ncbi:MAG TPA: M23 family metallopeptidase [Aggregatilineales bacterium]|nr:M23 family metallopeptidase [Aggregatilineales bacterium]